MTFNPTRVSVRVGLTHGESYGIIPLMTASPKTLQKIQDWQAANPDKVREYKKKYKAKVAEANRARRPALKNCSEVDCYNIVAHKSGPVPRCESCALSRKNDLARLRSQSPDSIAYRRQWRLEQGADYNMVLQRRYRFRIEPEDFAALLASQDDRCAICRTSEAGGRTNGWHIDHDHSCCSQNGKTCGRCVRGLLCNNCNAGLGLLGDNAEILRAAATYLDSFLAE